jgi:predicted HD superfamily hydrolase involved in NAD metabolism
MGASELSDLTPELDAADRRLQMLLSPGKHAHSLAVADAAARWAPAFGADPVAARWAGLVHDCARGLAPAAYLEHARAAGLELFAAERAAPTVLHQRLGARWAAERFGVRDPAVLAAIRCHTTGAGDMDALARCLFVVDWTSPDRTYEGVDVLRAALARGPDAGFRAVLGAKRDLVRRRALPEHPWARAAWDRWLDA